MSLEDVVKALQKTYDSKVVFKLDDNASSDIEVVSTGSIKIDAILGGGLPVGRLVEVLGTESSGKTTLALCAIAEAQKKGKVLFVDAEQSFDKNYAKALGVDVNALFLSQPDNAEQALTIIEEFAASGEVSLIILDSIAALSPKAEIDGDVGDSIMGVKARLMGQHCRRVSPIARKNNVTMLYINQLRFKIGVVFGNPETSPGGNAMKYQASIRIDMRKIGNVKEGDESSGIKIRVKTIKNKVFPPFKEAETEIIFGKGFNLVSEVVDSAVEIGVIKKTGAWFAYGDQKFQGKQSIIEKCENTPEFLAELKSKV